MNTELKKEFEITINKKVLNGKNIKSSVQGYTSLKPLNLSEVSTLCVIYRKHKNT